jgi:hypothetical protein
MSNAAWSLVMAGDNLQLQLLFLAGGQSHCLAFGLVDSHGLGIAVREVYLRRLKGQHKILPRRRICQMELTFGVCYGL